MQAADWRTAAMRTIAPLIAALLLCLAGLPASAQSAEPIGTVAGLTGSAVALRADGPVALRLGAPIRRRDEVRTLADAKLQIEFHDGSELVLGADSKVAIARYAPSDGRGLLKLLQGIVRAVLPESGSWRRFDVETRNAVASVRSTQWIVALSPEGTAVFAVAGAVAVRGGGAEVLLNEGQGTDVPTAGKPDAPGRWGRSRVDRVLQRTTL